MCYEILDVHLEFRRQVIVIRFENTQEFPFRLTEGDQRLADLSNVFVALDDHVGKLCT